MFWWSLFNLFLLVIVLFVLRCTTSYYHLCVYQLCCVTKARWNNSMRSHVAQSLIFCAVFCRSLFVFFVSFLLAIVLSVCMFPICAYLQSLLHKLSFPKEIILLNMKKIGQVIWWQLQRIDTQKIDMHNKKGVKLFLDDSRKLTPKIKKRSSYFFMATEHWHV